jgi:dephospho-CoA kinase
MSTERRAAPAGGIFVLGLVGRTGSGKSTVARTLAADGAEVIDADALGHAVTEHDAEVRAALASEYGADVYRQDGTLDRARVASKVFSDPAARERLNRLTHPRIAGRIQARLEELQARHFTGIAVIDAALLLDWRLERACDAVMAVVAGEPEQLERLARSRGWSADEVRLRLAAQRPESELRAAADVTLENDGTMEQLEIAARDAVRTLRARRAPARKEPC